MYDIHSNGISVGVAATPSEALRWWQECNAPACKRKIFLYSEGMTMKREISFEELLKLNRINEACKLYAVVR
jgi:hypothetical protein